ncbi:MAG: hypothetical protein U0T77_06970 [Chitinophagales bacterium]
MRKLLFILFSLIVTIVCSCKKENSSTVLRNSITAHTWKSTGVKKNGTPQSSWCWHNYLYNYTADGKVFIETASNAGGCIGSPAGTILKYSWSLSSDEKWLIINEGVPSSEMDSFQIISISDATLITKRVAGKSSPPTTTWEDTFTAVP